MSERIRQLLPRRFFLLGFAGLLGTWLFCGSPSLAAPPSQEPTERRVALIVGNSTYEHINTLPNPVRDAKAIADKLETIGFKHKDIVLKFNLKREEMKTVFHTFVTDLREEDLGLIFYAGHGIRADNGKDYLVPIDAPPAVNQEEDLDYHLINLNQQMQYLKKARAGVVFEDACRNRGIVIRARKRELDPRAVSTLDGGDRPPDVWVGYATQPGDPAYDGETQHSPFASALLQHIATPGLTLDDLFGKVVSTVRRTMSNRQHPTFTSSLASETRIYLGGAPVRESFGSWPAWLSEFDAQANPRAVKAQDEARLREACEIRKDGAACGDLGRLYWEADATPFLTERTGLALQRSCNLHSKAGCTNLALLNLYSGRKLENITIESICEQRDGRACASLGLFHINGTYGYDKNLVKAKRFLDLACSLGEAAGCLNLGMLYLKGVLSSNRNLATSYFSTAQELKSINSFSYIGYLYQVGSGDKGQSNYVAQDAFRARDYYKFGCDKGDAQSCYLRAVQLNQNAEPGGSQNGQAADLFKKSCTLGFAEGCNAAQTEPVNPEDWKSSLYLRACKLGSALGCYKVGTLISRMRFGFASSLELTKYYDLACKRGSIAACNNLARHLRVINLDGDKEEALSIFLNSCNSEHRDYSYLLENDNQTSAQACLEAAALYDEKEDPPQTAYLYIERNGKQDKQRELYQKACDLGLADGCQRLSFVYQQGFGIARSASLAQAYLEKAADLWNKDCKQSSGDACFALSTIIDDLSKAQRERIGTSGDRLRRLACDQNFVEACIGLDGVNVSDEALEVACGRGQVDACVRLAKSWRADSAFGERELPRLERACLLGSTLGCSRLTCLGQNTKEAAQSCTRLGGAYWMGTPEVPKDQALAMEYLHRGCVLGTTEACKFFNPPPEPPEPKPTRERRDWNFIREPHLAP